MPVSWSDIWNSFNDQVGGFGNVGAAASKPSKFRISSVVVDPISLTAIGSNGAIFSDTATPFDVIFSKSGNHYQSVDRNRLLRVKLGKDYGDDGQWMAFDEVSGKIDGSTLSEFLERTFCNIELSTPSGILGLTNQNVGSELHVRLVFQDREF